MKFIAGVIFLFMSVQLSAQVKQESIGLISAMITTSDFHTNAAGRQEIIFKIDSGHVTGCPWLGIPKENNSFTSFLLSAKAANKSVRVWYYSDLKTNSGSSVCQAYTIQLQ